MRGQVGSLRFEQASLGLVVLSVLVMYGLVLGEHAGRLVDTARPAAQVKVHEELHGLIASSPASSPVVVGGTASERASERVLPAAAVSPAGLGSDLDAFAGERIVSAADLAAIFRRIDYRLSGVGAGARPVPRIVIDRIPADLADMRSAAERKQVFIKMMLPLVLAANERILADRRRILEIRDRVGGRLAALGPGERAWLEQTSRRYGLERIDFSALLRRVDMIPPSLALAQAAEESGWGTSRFVREGNALFGQRTFKPGTGLVPRRRDDGARHEVRVFSRLFDSIMSYMVNLNTHEAYREFRLSRERQRNILGRLDGWVLAGALTRYSERGQAYVRTIRSIIEANGLRALDQARLGEEALILIADPKA